MSPCRRIAALLAPLLLLAARARLDARPPERPTPEPTSSPRATSRPSPAPRPRRRSGSCHALTVARGHRPGRRAARPSRAVAGTPRSPSRSATSSPSRTATCSPSTRAPCASRSRTPARTARAPSSAGTRPRSGSAGSRSCGSARPWSRPTPGPTGSAATSSRCGPRARLLPLPRPAQGRPGPGGCAGPVRHLRHRAAPDRARFRAGRLLRAAPLAGDQRGRPAEGRALPRQGRRGRRQLHLQGRRRRAGRRRR